jgi:hypothetical protein
MLTFALGANPARFVPHLAFELDDLAFNLLLALGAEGSLCTKTLR